MKIFIKKMSLLCFMSFLLFFSSINTSASFDNDISYEINFITIGPDESSPEIF